MADKLSQCLVLDMNMPQYLFLANPASTKAMMDSAYVQIANHMHICVAIKDDTGSLHAIASLEPILLEAASHIMLSEEFKFSLHGALLLVLGRYCVNQGERGELIVSSFTWAHDQGQNQNP